MYKIGQKLRAEEYTAELSIWLEKQGCYCRDIKEKDFIYEIVKCEPVSEEELAANAMYEKQLLIAEKKAKLMKYREDVEQVDLFGMERADYAEKKAACKTLVEELRELEKSLTKG